MILNVKESCSERKIMTSFCEGSQVILGFAGSVQVGRRRRQVAPWPTSPILMDLASSLQSVSDGLPETYLQ